MTMIHKDEDDYDGSLNCESRLLMMTIMTVMTMMMMTMMMMVMVMVVVRDDGWFVNE